jgi:hypothetical protein
VRNRRYLWILSAGTAVASLWTFLPAAAQALPTGRAAYTAPRTSDGKPDLQGIWKANNTANGDLVDHGGSYGILPGPGVVEGGEIPYQDWALAKKKENSANRENADPLNRCFLAGMPRTMYLPSPFQILQTPQAVIVVSEYVDTWRWIPTYNVPRYPGVEAWNGDSRGHWEGDTLVVESEGFNDSTWFDHAGDFHSEALKLTERFTRTASDVISYEATVDDSKVFTKPWKIKMPLYLQKDVPRIMENECYMYADEAGKGVHDTPPGASAVK